MPRLTGFPPTALPGPPAPWLLGPLPRVLQFFDDPVGAVRRLRPYGDVVGVARDSPALVCVFGAERNREVLGDPARFPNDEEIVPSRPGTPLGRMSRLLVNSNGDLHRRHRKLMTPAFSRAALDAYAPEIVRVTEAMVQRWPTEGVADLDALTRDLALCVAVQTLFGLDVVAGATELGELASRFIETLSSPLSIALPYDLPGLPYARANRLGGQLLLQLEALIARKRASAEPGRDALALLLAARDEEDGTLSDEELLAEVVTLYIAGHETSAKALLWTLLLLERHPQVLADLYDELDQLGDRPVALADLPRLPLLDRVLKESLRVLAPVPVTFLRVPVEDTTLGTVRLPRGCNLVVSPFATHHDPDLYAEPQRFLPERWERIRPGPYEYLPFGAGPRICLGASFAQMSLRLMIPTILRHRRWAILRDHDVSRRTVGNILGARHGVRARLQAAHRERIEPEPIRGDLRELVAFPER